MRPAIRSSIRDHGILFASCTVALLGGAAAGVALAPSGSSERTVTVPAARVGTVTRETTVTRVETVTEAARPPAGTAADGAPAGKPAPSPPAAVTAGTGGAGEPARVFGGTGPRRLGTITVRQPGATLRWTNRGGAFRLLYGRSGVAVVSRASAGRFGVPPMIYPDVRVESGGRWTIRLRQDAP